MKLIVHELQDTLSQSILSDAVATVEAVRVNLYKHNTPTGSVRLEIHSDNGVIAIGETLAISDISPEPFFHGQVRFMVNAHLMKDVEYQIVLRAIGYTFNESAYIGWCSDFDFQTYPTLTAAPHALLSPLDYELWTKA